MTREQQKFPARLAILRDTAVFAQAFCERHGIVRDDCMRLMLIIEELFTNSVEHGYHGESDAPIRIELSIEHSGIVVLYEDSAPPYDPLAVLAVPPASMAQPVEARPVGGLGVYLLSRLIEEASYGYQDGYNRLRLTMRLARSAMQG